MSPPPSELLELIKQSYANDPFFNGMEKEALRVRDGVVLRQNKDQILVPHDNGSALHKRVIFSHHVLPSAGHLGRDRTVELIQSCFVWPKMRADVEEFVSFVMTARGIKPPIRSQMVCCNCRRYHNGCGLASRWISLSTCWKPNMAFGRWVMRSMEKLVHSTVHCGVC